MQKITKLKHVCQSLCTKAQMLGSSLYSLAGSVICLADQKETNSRNRGLYTLGLLLVSLRRRNHRRSKSRRNQSFSKEIYSHFLRWLYIFRITGFLGFPENNRERIWWRLQFYPFVYALTDVCDNDKTRRCYATEFNDVWRILSAFRLMKH